MYSIRFRGHSRGPSCGGQGSTKCQYPRKPPVKIRVLDSFTPPSLGPLFYATSPCGTISICSRISQTSDKGAVSRPSHRRGHLRSGGIAVGSTAPSCELCETVRPGQGRRPAPPFTAVPRRQQSDAVYGGCDGSQALLDPRRALLSPESRHQRRESLLSRGRSQGGVAAPRPGVASPSLV